jgi:hypothetical protein
MAHTQKRDFAFRRKGRVHLNRWGRQFSRLLAAEVYASTVVMLDTPCSEVVWRVLPTPFASFPFTSPPVRHRVPSHFNWNLPTSLWLSLENRRVCETPAESCHAKWRGLCGRNPVLTVSPPELASHSARMSFRNTVISVTFRLKMANDKPAELETNLVPWHIPKRYKHIFYDTMCESIYRHDNSGKLLGSVREFWGSGK